MATTVADAMAQTNKTPGIVTDKGASTTNSASVVAMSPSISTEPRRVPTCHIAALPTALDSRPAAKTPSRWERRMAARAIVTMIPATSAKAAKEISAAKYSSG